MKPRPTLAEMKTLNHWIEKVAEDYVEECTDEYAEISVEGRNNFNIVQEEQILKLAVLDDDIRAMIFAEVRDRMMEKISELKMEHIGSNPHYYRNIPR